LSALPLLSPAEEQQLREWNATAASYPGADSMLPERIAAQVERSPEAVALEFADQVLTYAEMDARAGRLALRLRASGIGDLGGERWVGICAERSLELVLGLLAIWKAGAAYVPLAPAYPQERLAFMLADADLPVLLTQRRLLDRLPANRAA